MGPSALFIRLTFLDPVLLPMAASEHAFTFSLAAPPESVQVVEASPDLRTWSPVATNRVPGSGVIAMRDLSRYVDPAKIPANPMENIERRKREIAEKAVAEAKP